MPVGKLSKVFSPKEPSSLLRLAVGMPRSDEPLPNPRTTLDTIRNGIFLLMASSERPPVCVRSVVLMLGDDLYELDGFFRRLSFVDEKAQHSKADTWFDRENPA